MALRILQCNAVVNVKFFMTRRKDAPAVLRSAASKKSDPPRVKPRKPAPRSQNDDLSLLDDLL